jgi:hypothetical protein
MPVLSATLMMFAPPVGSFHHGHRGAWKLSGKLPQ